MSSREVTSIDGPVKLLEMKCHCDACHRDFFPLRETLGFDAREFTPQAVLRITIMASEVRSLKRAEKVLREAVNLAVSDNTIRRIIGDVDQELAERRDAAPSSAKALAIRPENVPRPTVGRCPAVVECDGGRIRTREMGRDPGVPLSETGWREDKHAG